MAQGFYRDPGDVRVLEPVIGANSEVFAMGSPVTINSSGFLAVATSSGEKIIGYSIQEATMASDNQTVAQVKPLIVDPIDVTMLYSSSGALAQTDIGEYADVASVSSGVATLGNPGTTGQFLLMLIDPYQTGDTTQGVWRVAEPQQFAFAQS